MPVYRGKYLMFFGLAVVVCALASGAQAKTEAVVTETEIFFPMAHVATFLFLMLGPSKIIGPFVQLTVGAERELQRKIAVKAVLFSGIALLIAGVLGELALKKHGVPLPILALAGGVVLTLVAIQDTVRQFAYQTQETNLGRSEKPSMKIALDPLAFPVIVTPYGIAALIVFLSFAPDNQSRFAIGGIVCVILIFDLLAMLFAHKLLSALGVGLAILGAVLSVVQVALGLQIISNSFRALGVL